MKNCLSPLRSKHRCQRDWEEFREEKNCQYINVHDSTEWFKVGTYIIGTKMTILLSFLFIYCKDEKSDHKVEYTVI